MQGAEQAERVRPAHLRLSAASASLAGERFGALDAWRGVAALAVALYRLNADGWFYHLSFVRNAWLFVDFFFVLSGFVIAYAYLARLDDARAVGVFTIRRFGRLWPLHIFMLLAFIGVEILRGFGGEPTFQDHRALWTIAADATLVQALGFTGWTDWNSPAWSISTEFWTYLVFAALCLSVKRWMAIASILVAVASLALLALFSPSGMDATFDFGMLRCLAGFFTGVALFLLWQRIKDRVQPGDTTAIEIAMLAIVVGFVAMAGHGPAAFGAPIVFGTAVLVFAFERGALSRAMRTRPFQFLGELSYSIYMTALFVALAFNQKLIPRIEGAPMDLVALVYLAAVVAASWVTYRLVEQPGRWFFNRIAARYAKPGATA